MNIESHRVSARASAIQTHRPGGTPIPAIRSSIQTQDGIIRSWIITAAKRVINEVQTINGGPMHTQLNLWTIASIVLAGSLFSLIQRMAAHGGIAIGQKHKEPQSILHASDLKIASWRSIERLSLRRDGSVN